MKNPLKIIFISLSAVAIVGVGLAAGLPWLATIDNTPAPISRVDEGEIVDHIFEFEDAIIDGDSANSGADYGHLCSNKSLYAYPGFSNGLVLRNISKKAATSTSEGNNPTLTFMFTSDKEYNVPIDISVASKYSSGWVLSTLGACFDSITINNRKLSYSTIPIPAEKSEVSGGNYYNMQLVTIPSCRIFEGENTLVFTPATGYLNCDYFNIRTSAKIVQIDSDSLIDDVEEDIEVVTEPTSTSNGSLRITCHQPGCTYTDTCVLPRLAEGNGYLIEEISDTETGYSFFIYDREFYFSVHH